MLPDENWGPFGCPEFLAAPGDYLQGYLIFLIGDILVSRILKSHIYLQVEMSLRKYLESLTARETPELF